MKYKLGRWRYALDSESLELHHISWMQKFIISLLQQAGVRGDLLDRISANTSKTIFCYKGLRFFGIDLAPQSRRMAMTMPM
jgi:hypothetical protein